MSGPTVVIISGGTMVHVRPHFSLCAPAYGMIGSDLAARFIMKDSLVQHGFNIENIKTKMADPHSRIETNEDVSDLIDELLADPKVKCIIMSAAICDFEAAAITSHSDLEGEDFKFSSKVGKKFGRLKSTDRAGAPSGYDLDIRPYRKLIGKIKLVRPDIVLVTFKTTTGANHAQLLEKCKGSYAANKSDIVFGNDISERKNMVYYGSDDVHHTGSRPESVNRTVDFIINRLLKTE